MYANYCNVRARSAMAVTMALTMAMTAALLAVTPGCARRSAAEGRMSSIEINRKSLRTVQGRMVEEKGSEKTEVPFTAYFQQMELQLIEEQKEGSAVQERFYFSDGRLFYFREVSGEQVGRRFIVDRYGKLVGTQPAPFPEQDYQLIAARAEKLKDQAMQRAGHMFVLSVDAKPLRRANARLLRMSVAAHNVPKADTRACEGAPALFASD